MTELAAIGHNGAPDPIEEVTTAYASVIEKVANWTDGEPVSDEAGMNAVDALLKEFKTYRSELAKAAKERTAPLHKAWKDEVAATKVYTDDADMMQKALVACVAPFKEKLAAEKREAERKAWEEAEAKRREAEAKAAESNAADLEARREAQAAAQAAIDAENAAKAATKDKPKGMRKVTHFEVTDYSDMLRWLNKHDRAALEAFCDEYARKHHKDGPIVGVRTWVTKEAF